MNNWSAFATFLSKFVFFPTFILSHDSGLLIYFETLKIIQNQLRLTVTSDHSVKTPVLRAGSCRPGLCPDILNMSKDRDSTSSLGNLLQYLTTWHPHSEPDPWPTLSGWAHCWQHSLKSQWCWCSQGLVWHLLAFKSIFIIDCQMTRTPGVCSSLPWLCFWSCVCYQWFGRAAVWALVADLSYCLNKVCFIPCCWTCLCLGHTTLRMN